VSEISRDPSLRPIFILGCSFRSGSTFLQRLVNSTDEAFIWGENVGLSEELIAVVAKLRSWREISRVQALDLESEGGKAWIANLTPAIDELEPARAFLKCFYSEPTRLRGVLRWGFKEVRHDASVAAFLLELFPAARVILLVRDPRAVLASMATSAWYSHAGGAKAIVAAWKRAVDSFLAFDDPRALLLRLEDVQELGVLEQIATHLEIESSRFDTALLYHRIRGSLAAPALGDTERTVLADPDLKALSQRLGY
jgi:Sulfotransferase family